jgi:hypothetical protein
MHTIRIVKLTAIFILVLGFSFLSAQNPPHPNGGGAPGSGNTVVGGQQGGAPVGSGTFLLLGLAVMYGTRKAFNVRNEAAE